MSTSKSQRIGIWVIAVVLTVGTIAGFVVMTLQPQNELAEQERLEQEYKQLIAEQQAQARKENKPLDGFKAASFDPDSVKKLEVEIIKEGDGKAAKADSTVTANYFGWNSDGEIFDSTNKNGELSPAEFGLDQVIPGWQKGLTGVREGSVVKLSIPADQAYGDIDTGTGQPTGPLKFVVILEKVS